jgi:hypothetical protein
VHKSIRLLGTLLATAGVLTLAWVVVVWRWEDPFTAIYTHVEQTRLSHTYEQRAAAFHPRLSPGELASSQQRLQACHPRFFATHRYIVDAPLVSVVPALRSASS